MAKSRKFKDVLIEALKDPEEAKMYFDAILEECKDCSEVEVRQLILKALKNITEAQGGINELAAKTHLGRQSLYKTLSPEGNPKLSTFISITNALGISLAVYKN